MFEITIDLLTGILKELGMNSVATGQLSYEQGAEFDREQMPATGKRWSRRWTFLFVIGASALLWSLIIQIVIGGL